ncbi:MAG: DUF4252 domain-containing protein [Alistipes sp.]|nr:DUF4252 domain-containing protein [Alistipes sp.]MDE7130108.1 DUF4252 domain-containing protein [Alistipes sp.]
MKKFIILLLMLSPLAAAAQNDAYKALFDDCVGRDGYSTVQVSKQMLRMMDSNYNMALASIDGVMSVTFDSDDAEAMEAFRKRCDQMLDRSGLSVMVSTNDGKQSVKIYTLTVEEKIKEVIVMTCSCSEIVVVDVVGDLSLKQISQLKF